MSSKIGKLCKAKGASRGVTAAPGFVANFRIILSVGIPGHHCSSFLRKRGPVEVTITKVSAGRSSENFPNGRN